MSPVGSIPSRFRHLGDIPRLEYLVEECPPPVSFPFLMGMLIGNFGVFLQGHSCFSQASR